MPQNRHRHFSYRANDDGEPSNSAGMPIYGQFSPFSYKHTVVVARIFEALTRRWRINRLQQPHNSRLKVVKLSKNDRYPLSGFI
jgi:hypothetical protein